MHTGTSNHRRKSSRIGAEGIRKWERQTDYQITVGHFSGKKSYVKCTDTSIKYAEASDLTLHGCEWKIVSPLGKFL
jgi:hypothetical protein